MIPKLLLLLTFILGGRVGFILSPPECELLEVQMMSPYLCCLAPSRVLGLGGHSMAAWSKREAGRGDQKGDVTAFL